MTTDAFYLLRRTEARAGFAELDAVALLRPVSGDAGATIPTGETGTVVAVLEDGGGYVVEFGEPAGTLATVADADLRAA